MWSSSEGYASVVPKLLKAMGELWCAASTRFASFSDKTQVDHARTSCRAKPDFAVLKSMKRLYQ